MSATTMTISAPAARRNVVPNGVLAMLIFVCTEIMFFSGLISAFVIGRASAGMWPPPGQPRLPVEATAFNTAVLLLSGIALFLSHRALKAPDGKPRVLRYLTATILLGGAFVVLQGYEWLGLLRYGLTVTSSTYGAFFYVIVGTHGLHAVLAICMLTWVLLRMRGDRFEPVALWTAGVFWYFVVGLWPVLYGLVYLS